MNLRLLISFVLFLSIKTTTAQTISVNNNQLNDFILKNGNNTNITNFSSKINPHLHCIEVDNPNYSDYHWGNNVDSQTTFLVNCN
ncbi:MAG: hypothetical protein HWD85_07965 [Flavobacteriaceae bacterium]|nr:hypothetical protein [Flavobacteriaceae bacterium]